MDFKSSVLAITFSARPFSSEQYFKSIFNNSKLLLDIRGEIALSLLNGKLAFKMEKGKIKKIDI